MATIVERRRKDGTVSYLAQIIKRSHAYQKLRSVPSRKISEPWVKKRQQAIDAAIAAGRPLASQRQDVMTFGDAIDHYIQECRQEMEDEGASPPPHSQRV